LPQPIPAKPSPLRVASAQAGNEEEAGGGCGFLRQEGNRVWIAGVPPLRFGAGQDNSVIVAYTTLLNAIGERSSYDDLMGRSGAAFRLQLAQPQWCPSAPVACCGYDCTARALSVTGHRARNIACDPKDADACRVRNDLVMACIDAGAPVLWIEKEAGLIVGYEDAGRWFLRHYPMDRGEQPTRFDNFSWGTLLILSERSELPPRRQTVIESLELALELDETPAWGNYAAGSHAWRLWIQQLADEARFEGLEGDAMTPPMLANAWMYDSLLDARGAASRYLQRIASEFEPRTAAHLQRAARAYEELALTLIRGQSHRCYPWTLAQAARWSADMRRAQAEVLKQAFALEQQALQCLRLALATAP
jgi:hypothetical protein